MGIPFLARGMGFFFALHFILFDAIEERGGNLS